MSDLDQQRILALWRRLGGHGRADELFHALVVAYAEPHRAYHTAAHLRACLNQFDQVCENVEQPDHLEMALWFHDAVYDPHAADNEAQSATWAFQALTNAQISPTVAQTIAALVLATKHQEGPQAGDAQWMVDIDLAILGAAPAVFAEYDRQIRVEYQWVAEETYRARRSQVLARFLPRSTIYQTHFFATRYEQQARQNLIQAIDQLMRP